MVMAVTTRQSATVSQGGTATTKRKREQENSPLPATKKAFLKDTAYWYSDGNILLQAGGVRFKVHRTRLASASVFQITFAKLDEGQSPEYATVDPLRRDIIDSAIDNSEYVDGLPLLFLFYSTAAEVKALLNGIYNGIDYAFNPPGIDEIVLLTSSAIYYDATSLVNYAKNYLKAIFPTNLTSLQPDPSIHVAAQGVLAAKYTSSFGIRSTAFYDLARASTSSIEESISSSDDALEDDVPSDNAARISTLKANTVEVYPVTSTKAKWATFNTLHREDILRLNVLQRHLSASWDDIMGDILSMKFTDGCVKSCKDGLILVVKRFTSIKAKNISDPIFGIKALVLDDMMDEFYCASCTMTLMKALKNRRTTIWNNVQNNWIK